MSLAAHKMPIVIALSLVALTLVTYWGVRQNEFVNYDDGTYITENPIVQQGLTGDGIAWACTTGYGSNWHPLTWISHMLDIELYGLDPAGHHTTNLFFHAAAAVLLYFALKRMTGALWPSAFVAAVFALHPAHVESVAWAAERKDVLSAFFWMLTMLAYAHYVDRPSVSRYLVVAISFAVGLLAKPMLVTLPFVLLLLDIWPLRRLDSRNGEKLKSARTGSTIRRNTVQKLVLEKIPLIALALASSVVTFVVQEKGGSVNPLWNLPLDGRIANALVAYVRYIGKTFWPSALSVYYPHTGLALLTWQAITALVLLAAVTYLVIRHRARLPFLGVGWFWFVGVLVPVIGIVQVGNQSMADRYSYIPMIGLSIMIAWGVNELSKRWSTRQMMVAVGMTVAVLAMSFLTWRQIGFWRDSITLFEHAIAVTNNNWIAHNNLGQALHVKKRYEEAITHYQEVLKIQSNYAEAHNNMGLALAALGRTAEAHAQYQRAVSMNPALAEAQCNYGSSLADRGEFVEAVRHFEEAIRLRPQYAIAYNFLGLALRRMGSPDRSVEAYRQAIRIDPQLAEAYYNLADLFAAQSQYDSALVELRNAVRVRPDYAEAHNNLGILYAMRKNNEEALKQFEIVKRLKPSDADAFYNAGLLYAEQGKTNVAVGEYREALRLNPGHANARAALDRALQQQQQAVR
jgi:tetratricopeptide (TPR) repeat protein